VLGARVGGDGIASRTAAETAKDAASTAKATPTPKTATNQPPTAGPARRSVIGRTNWSSEFAAGRSAAGRMSGTIASKAGVKKAVPTPYTATSATSCQKVRRPVSESTARTPITTPRPTSAHNMTRRRSTRSLITPAGNRSARVGIVIPIPRMERAAGAFHRT
jgi:hypothetical protein